MSTMDVNGADLFAAATGSGTPLESERRVATGESRGLVGVGGLIDTVQLGDNAEVLASLPSECVDLVVTSPPYDSLREYGGHSWNFDVVALEMTRTLKPGGVLVWVVADKTVDGSESGTSMRQALGFMDAGLRLHDTMIFRRKTHPLYHRRYEQEFEFMFVLSKGAPKAWNGLMRKSAQAGVVRRNAAHRNGDDIEKRGTGKATPEMVLRGNIWDYNVGGPMAEAVAFEHPAIFPEALAKDHIASWSNPGDLVCDPFAGSGTTLKAAKELNRHWLGIEINPAYVEICRARLAQDVLMLFPAGGGGAELVAKDSCDSPKPPNVRVSDSPEGKL